MTGYRGKCMIGILQRAFDAIEWRLGLRARWRSISATSLLIFVIDFFKTGADEIAAIILVHAHKAVSIVAKEVAHLLLSFWRHPLKLIHVLF